MRSELPTPPSWYAAPDITWRRALSVGALPVLLLTVFSATRFGETAAARIARPVEFFTRHVLNRDPVMDPRLHIRTFGDSTLAWLGDAEMPLDLWADVIEAFAPARPRAVLVDMVFGAPRGRERSARFVERLRRLPFPVIVGAFTTQTSIVDRPPLALDDPLYRVEDVAAFRRYPADAFAYGPMRSIQDAFAHVGHLHYEGGGLIAPLRRVSPTRAIPFAPFLTAREFRIDAAGVHIDGKPVPEDRFGRVLLNPPPPMKIRNRTFPLKAVLERVKNNRPLAPIPPDSVVLILPQMFTGNVDMKDSPFGPLPGGYMVAAAVSSVLNGSWIRFPPVPWLAVFLCGLFGITLAIRVGGLAFTGSLLASVVLIAAAGNALFTYRGISVPWLLSATGFALSAIVVFLERARVSDRKRRALRDALAGSVPPDVVTALLRDPAALRLRPSERFLTVMFVDIVGFSIIAERTSPDRAFATLKNLLADITDTVLAFGGTVDKTLGDGVLCFFGHRYDGSESMRDHADQAVRCAIEIQRRTLRRSLDATSHGEPPYPIRIGVNTDLSYIGDLGSGWKLDLTVIGSGVNFAKRLEAACDPYRIMIGEATRKSLTSELPLGTSLEKRHIQVKHYEQLVDAWECDPLAGEEESVARADAAFRAVVGAERKDTRWPAPLNEIVVNSDTGSGFVRNFSATGFAVDFNRYLGRGATFEITLDDVSGALGEKLVRGGLTPLVAEVRWGRRGLDGGLHRLGVALKNCSALQRRRLVTAIRTVGEDTMAPAKVARRRRAASGSDS